MSVPSGYLPRAGDVVILRAIVQFDVDPGETDVHLKAEHNRLAVGLDKIVDVVRRAWKEGDLVMTKGCGPGEVLATHAHLVWVKVSAPAPETGFDIYTCDSMELELVPPPAEAPEAPPAKPEAPPPFEGRTAVDAAGEEYPI